MDEDSWKTHFAQVLDSVQRVGSVATGKVLAIQPPKLNVEGLGDEHVAFPLLQRQALELRELAEQSPFGKGSHTLVDLSVRKSWQIDATKITVGGSKWQKILETLVGECCSDLGIDPEVSARVQPHLYKLLLYEKGGFFKPHQDSEKEPGMFGTLIVQLPSRFEGGALVVRHKGQKMVYDCSKHDSEETCFYTAFYGDCEHEVLPVTAGWRLCLVYNLVVTAAATTQDGNENRVVQPSASLALADVDELRLLAASWRDFCSHNMQGYLLEHEYTETNFDHNMLKGRDKHVVDFLLKTKDSDGKPLFDVFLLLLEKHSNGQPEYDDPNTMGEVIESEIANYQVTRISEDDTQDEDGEDEVRDGFDAEYQMLESCEINDEFPDDPDHQEYKGYQGNWGPTLEYWYYKGVVVFRPAKDSKRSASKSVVGLTQKKARPSGGKLDDPS